LKRKERSAILFGNINKEGNSFEKAGNIMIIGEMTALRLVLLAFFFIQLGHGVNF
jgi:hypothetical protein